MPTPRPAPIAGLVSPYVQEQKLLRTYRRLLVDSDLDQLITATLGPKRTQSQLQAADERLEHVMPELIQKLRPEQQAPLLTLLLEQEDLVGSICYLISVERNLTHRDEDPRLHINDDGRLKAAGLGQLTQANYRKTHDPKNPSPRWLSRNKQVAPPLGPPLELTPWPPVAPRFRGVRSKHKRTTPLCKGQLMLPFLGGGVALEAL